MNLKKLINSTAIKTNKEPKIEMSVMIVCLIQEINHPVNTLWMIQRCSGRLDDLT